MKTYIVSFAVGALMTISAPAFAGMLDAENANKGHDYSQAELDDFSSDVADGYKDGMSGGKDSTASDKVKADQDAAEKAEEEAAAKKAEAKCIAAADKAGEKTSAASEKAMEQACVGIDYTQKNPTGSVGRVTSAEEAAAGKEFSSLGQAHGAMLGGEATLSTFEKPDLTKVNSNLMDKVSVLKNGELSGNFGEGTKTATDLVNAQANRDATGKATVAIGGLGDGIVDNCKTCKRGTSADWNDSSLIKTDVETARATRFGESDLTPGKTNYNGFNQSVSVPDSLKGAKLTSSQLEMAAYIDARGRDLGMSDEVRKVAISTVYRESKFNPFIGANQNGTGPYRDAVDSSAYGLGQNLSGNWTDQFKDGTNGGEVLNRNNTVNQIDVLFGDVNERYTKYNNSTALQSKYSFGEYDYINHYAGSLSAPQFRIDKAISVYNANHGMGDKIAGYVMDGSGGGTLIAGNTTKTGGTVIDSSGLGSTVKQLAGVLGGGNSNAITGLITQMTGGGGDTAALVNAVMNGDLSTNDIIQIATNLAVQKLISGGSKSDGNDENDSDNATSSGTGGSSVKITQAVRDLASSCGADLPKTKDALMLMIKSCQG